MMPAPILIFVYNRPKHTAELLRSLQNNEGAENCELIFYADGPKPGASENSINDIATVRNLIQDLDWPKSKILKFSDQNKGLAQSIITGVTETLKSYDKVIVLEDDMVLSSHFLNYMNDALEKYEDDARIISIHGYSLPIPVHEPYFLRGADCWGWATWRRGWTLFNPDGKQLKEQILQRNLAWEFDMDGTYPYLKMLQNQIEGINDSWAIRWHASAFLANKLTLYPGLSLVKNTGSDNSGTHKQDVKAMETSISLNRVIIRDVPVVESTSARLLIVKHLLQHANLKRKIKHLLRWGY